MDNHDLNQLDGYRNALDELQYNITLYCDNTESYELQPIWLFRAAVMISSSMLTEHDFPQSWYFVTTLYADAEDAIIYLYNLGWRANLVDDVIVYFSYDDSLEDTSFPYQEEEDFYEEFYRSLMIAYVNSNYCAASA